MTPPPAPDANAIPRTIAIDYGTVRVGVAISDPLGISAQPLEAVMMGENAEGRPAMERIVALIAQHGVKRVVIGLPRNMDGSEGPSAKAARRFGTWVQKKSGCELIEWDERLTSVMANQALRDSKPTAKSRRKAAQSGAVDVIAAQLILQGYLDREAAKLRAAAESPVAEEGEAREQ